MIAGRYQLEREIGRGGMGAVWLAHDEVLDRAVALKRLGWALGDQRDLRRAVREARLAATLSHSHVVAIFDLVVEDDHQWLVMEYVEGLTLAQLVHRDGPLSPDRTAELLEQAAGALAAAHESGIVHRDVKPSNMLVADDGHLRLSDFGIARTAGDDTMTQTGMVVGSPAYLAPEVASGHQATAASDVWSLGATVYFALTGAPAYDADGNVIGMLYRIVHDEPPRPADAGWLAPLLEHTMAMVPEDRWSMAQVQAFLGRGPAVPTTVGPSPTPLVEEPEPDSTQVLPEIVAADIPARPGRRASAKVVAGVAAAVVLVAALALWVLLGGDDPGTQPPDASRSNGSPSGPTSPGKTSPGSTTPGPTAAGMTTFVKDYLATVTTDQEAAWKELTPEFQARSGSFQDYRKAWLKRAGAEVSNIVADTTNLTVSYDVTYLDKKGERLFDDHPTLTLVFRDGSYLIDDEA